MMGWATKLMEAKGIFFNDEWHGGTAKTVVLNNPNKDNLMYEASLSYSHTTKSYVSNKKENCLPPDKTGILDSVATHMYIAPNAPYGKMNTTEKQIRVGTSNGQVASSIATATLPIPQLNSYFPHKRIHHA